MSTPQIRTAILYAAMATSAFSGLAAAQTPDSGTMRAPPTATDSMSRPGRDTDRTGSDRMGSDRMGKSSAMPVTAQSFVTQAANTDMAEIELGQLAMKNSQDPAVKKFAEQMVKDHTATSTKLKGLAAKDNIALPKALDSEHAAVKAKLAGLKGKEFDQAYGMEMAKGHQKAVALFESASQETAITGDLKQFATSTLPKLREHEDMAHGLHAKEGA
jgi:putative membrane protein